MLEDLKNLYSNSARFYDYDYRDNLTADIPFYLDYADKTGGEVLELGCGTGRVAIPLAEAGFSVTGLDLSDSMLEVFKEKLNSEPEKIQNSVTLYKGDMSNYSLGKNFGLIIAPFRAFQSLTEDKDITGCLRCTARHLKDDGLFIVNVFRPYKVLDESWRYPEEIQWTAYDDKRKLNIVKKHSGPRIDTEKQIIYPEFKYEAAGENGVKETATEKLALKYYYYPQLKKLLITNGFTIAEEFGWYDKSGIDNGREMIFVCRKSIRA